MAAVEAGAEAKRKRRLKTAGVVGSTCCAALVAEALQGIRFDVVVLDEAAQVVEPLALAPILRSGCRCLTYGLQRMWVVGSTVSRETEAAQPSRLAHNPEDCRRKVLTTSMQVPRCSRGPLSAAPAGGSTAGCVLQQHRQRPRQQQHRRSQGLWAVPLRAPGGCWGASAPAAEAVPLPPRHRCRAQWLLLRCGYAPMTCMDTVALWVANSQGAGHFVVLTLCPWRSSGGQLLDGVSAADRPPLLPGCPPLVVLDVRCAGDVPCKQMLGLFDCIQRVDQALPKG